MNRRQLLQSAAAVSLTGTALGRAAEQKGALKLTGLETEVRRSTPGTRYYDSIHQFGTDGGSVVLRLRTDAGITGWASSSFGMIGGGPTVVQTILEREIKPVLMGKDPAYPRRIREELWK